jgi:hypothetical protein
MWEPRHLTSHGIALPFTNIKLYVKLHIFNFSIFSFLVKGTRFRKLALLPSSYKIAKPALFNILDGANLYPQDRDKLVVKDPALT